MRAAIKASTEPASALAERFGTTEQTVYKWKHRDSVHDRSHMPHRLQTTLTPEQEVVAVVLRKTLLVSFDDLLAVVREFLNSEVPRSGLDRCLRRRGMGNLRNLQAQSPRPQHKTFKAYEPAYALFTPLYRSTGRIHLLLIRRRELPRGRSTTDDPTDVQARQQCCRRTAGKVPTSG